MDADRPTRPGPEDPAAVDSCSWLLGRRQLGQSEATTIVTEGKHIKVVPCPFEVIRKWLLSVGLSNYDGGGEARYPRWLCFWQANELARVFGQLH